MDVVPESQRQRGRRLCELLAEQQELLEHGYSDRAVNSAACICWLGSACRRLKRLSDDGFKKRKKKTKVMWLLIKRAWRWNAAAIDRAMKGNRHGVKFHRLSSSAVTDDAEMDKEERSPVSVLALHSHEVEEESTSPSSSDSTQETKNSSSIQEDCTREFEESLPGCNESIAISELIDRDLSKSKKEWAQFEHERREVGTEIEHIIFEEIRRETALDLLLHCNCTLQTPVDSSLCF